jgi:hypothetical protein
MAMSRPEAPFRAVARLIEKHPGETPRGLARLYIDRVAATGYDMTTCATRVLCELRWFEEQGLARREAAAKKGEPATWYWTGPSLESEQTTEEALGAPPATSAVGPGRVFDLPEDWMADAESDAPETETEPAPPIVAWEDRDDRTLATCRKRFGELHSIGPLGPIEFNLRSVTDTSESPEIADDDDDPEPAVATEAKPAPARSADHAYIAFTVHGARFTFSHEGRMSPDALWMLRRFLEAVAVEEQAA